MRSVLEVQWPPSLVWWGPFSRCSDHAVWFDEARSRGAVTTQFGLMRPVVEVQWPPSLVWWGPLLRCSDHPVWFDEARCWGAVTTQFGLMRPVVEVQWPPSLVWWARCWGAVTTQFGLMRPVVEVQWPPSLVWWGPLLRCSDHPVWFDEARCWGAVTTQFGLMRPVVEVQWPPSLVWWGPLLRCSDHPVWFDEARCWGAVTTQFGLMRPVVEVQWPHSKLSLAGNFRRWPAGLWEGGNPDHHHPEGPARQCPPRPDPCHWTALQQRDRQVHSQPCLLPRPRPSLGCCGRQLCAHSIQRSSAWGGTLNQEPTCVYTCAKITRVCQRSCSQCHSTVDCEKHARRKITYMWMKVYLVVVSQTSLESVKVCRILLWWLEPTVCFVIFMKACKIWLYCT